MYVKGRAILGHESASYKMKILVAVSTDNLPIHKIVVEALRGGPAYNVR